MESVPLGGNLAPQALFAILAYRGRFTIWSSFEEDLVKRFEIFNRALTDGADETRR